MVFYFEIALVFLLGTAVGSFLNVLIYRLPRGEEVVRKRSHCPDCGTPLLWYDLIPLFSWIILRGKCRYCKSKISWQYPAVELATGVMFVVATFMVASGKQGFAPLAGIRLSLGDFKGSTFSLWPILKIFPISELPVTSYQLPVALFHWFILSALLVIFVVDLKHYIIPDKVLAPLFVVTLIYRISLQFPPHVRLILKSSDLPITNYFLSSVGTAAFFLLLVLLTKGKGMGLGDVKYGAFMGLLLGFPYVVVALYTAFLTGAVVSVILLLTGKKKFGQVVPFGPFLVGGTVFAFYYGDLIWRMVSGFY